MNYEQEMAEGYTDGRNPDAPEPSENRSASYRHGFAVGRSDRAGQPAFGSAMIARMAADRAIKDDSTRYGPQ
jgi:hypothetical protein